MGEQLSLEVGDDGCDPKEAVAVANRWPRRASADGRAFCSGSSIPASAVYKEEGVVQISPASTNPKFTDERPGPGITASAAGTTSRARLPAPTWPSTSRTRSGDPARQVGLR